MSRSPVTAAALSLADVREVELWFDGRIEPTRHLVPKDDVDALVAASVRLHHDPGVNPHSGRRTAALRRIRVSSFEVGAPCWWSTPDLGRNDDAAGARLISRTTATVFTSPAYEAEQAAEQADIDAAECGER